MPVNLIKRTHHVINNKTQHPVASYVNWYVCCSIRNETFFLQDVKQDDNILYWGDKDTAIKLMTSSQAESVANEIKKGRKFLNIDITK